MTVVGRFLPLAKGRTRIVKPGVLLCALRARLHLPGFLSFQVYISFFYSRTLLISHLMDELE
jgi:hypothetical protein